MTWAAHHIVRNRWPNAVQKLLDNPGSRKEAESLRSEMARELDCCITMPRVIHVQPPPPWVEMLTTQFHGVEPE